MYKSFVKSDSHVRAARHVLRKKQVFVLESLGLKNEANAITAKRSLIPYKLMRNPTSHLMSYLS